MCLPGPAGSQAGQASAQTELGAVHCAAGDHAAAARALQQALGLYRRLGDRLGEAHALTSLGTVWFDTVIIGSSSSSSGSSNAVHQSPFGASASAGCAWVQPASSEYVAGTGTAGRL